MNELEEMRTQLPQKFFVRFTEVSLSQTLICMFCLMCGACSPAPVDLHEGCLSLHEYEFKGKGTPHTEEEVKKYGLDDWGSRGSDVSVKVHVEWPEVTSGLSEAALAKVRRAILWMAFASEAPTVWKDQKTPIYYIVPEALGETEVSLKGRIKVLCAKEGYQWEDGEFGLSPADWGRLTDDALSHQAGRAPVKGEERLATNALELAMSGIKRRAQDCYRCDPAEENHGRSQWDFRADQHLDWPFGFVAKEGGEWYEHPVLCVWNEGYSNDGGNGCHAFYCAKVYNLPDGTELSAEDYFSEDKLKEVAVLVWERLLSELPLDDEEVKAKKDIEIDLSDNEVSMRVTREGITWSFDAYSYFAGCYGVTSVTLKWDELTRFRNEGFRHKESVP